MNKSIKIQYILTVAALAMLAVISGCTKEAETEEQKVKKEITTSWKIKSLMVDATDRTTIYPAFELTFSSAGTYTSTGGMPVWPASGVWKLTDKNTIDRDGVALHIDEVSATSLTLSMDWNKTTYSAGRRSSISGHHVFVLEKK